MKRMTLLTSLITVFSLISATAAIADSGSKAGDGSQNTDTVMTQTQERHRAQVQEPACQAGDPESECEAVQERTQNRVEVRVSEHDGECPGTDPECEPVQDQNQDQNQTRDRKQARLHEDDACAGADCEQLREMTRTEMQERIMRRLAAFADGSGEGEYLRVLMRRVLAYLHGPISALFT